MCRRNFKPLIPILLAILMAACTSEDVTPTPTTTPVPVTSTAISAYSITEIAVEAKATTDAQATAAFKATEAQATQIAEQWANQATATSEALIEATSQAQPLFDQVADLQASGFLSATEGSYFALPDFDASWAQLNYYDWLLTGVAPSNFVLRADTEWESASATANWWNSGCGFAFRINARGDHYLVYLGLDGWVYLYRNFSDTVTKLGGWYYDEVQTPAGSAKIMFIVENDWITFFVNDRQVDRHQDGTFSSGLLGYVIVSGTNKDYGTRCRMTDVELWELESP
jgi:hypothetical protein